VGRRRNWHRLLSHTTNNIARFAAVWEVGSEHLKSLTSFPEMGLFRACLPRLVGRESDLAPPRTLAYYLSALAITLIGLLVVEYLSKPPSTSQVPLPEYVSVFTDLPGNEGASDWTLLRSGRLSCFIPSIHENPPTLGYLARAPQGVDTKDHWIISKSLLVRTKFGARRRADGGRVAPGRLAKEESAWRDAREMRNEVHRLPSWPAVVTV
jgi:hypothetical protein